jgi:hypothetical protein
MGLMFNFLSPDNTRLERFLKEWKKKEPGKLTGAKKDDYYKPIDEFIRDDEFEEDTALPNGTSIAFLLTWHDKNFLFLADAHPSVIQESLESKNYSEKNKISCEIVKVAHHGSKANSSPDLLKLIDSKNYIISTNGDKDQHPHKQFLARLINLKKNCKIYFNYEERSENILKQPGDEKYRNILNRIDEKDFEYLL